MYIYIWRQFTREVYQHLRFITTCHVDKVIKVHVLDKPQVLLHSLGTYTQYSVISQNGKEHAKESYTHQTHTLCCTAEINTTLEVNYTEIKNNFRASLVAQWLRIHLPMHGTRVRALVQEDPACHGATKPVHHNYWVCVPQLLKPVHLEPVLCNKRSHRNGKPNSPQWRVAPARRN